MRRDVLAHRPEQHADEAAIAPGPDDEQIGDLRRREELLSGVAFDDLALDPAHSMTRRLGLRRGSAGSALRSAPKSGSQTSVDPFPLSLISEATWSGT